MKLFYDFESVLLHYVTMVTHAHVNLFGIIHHHGVWLLKTIVPCIYTLVTDGTTLWNHFMTSNVFWITLILSSYMPMLKRSVILIIIASGGWKQCILSNLACKSPCYKLCSIQLSKSIFMSIIFNILCFDTFFRGIWPYWVAY